MAGLVPAIHVFAKKRTWVPAFAGMTVRAANRHFAGFFQILRFCISATCLSITSRL